MRVLLASLVMTSLIISGTAHAQNFTGTYTTTSKTGGTVTLSLLQDAQGRVTGTLSADDVNYTLNGLVEDRSVLGTASSAAGGLYFAAELDAGQLYVTLFKPGANNQPNYETGETVVFRRTGGAEPPPVTEPPPAPAARAAPTSGGSVESGLRIAFGLPRIIAANVYLSRGLVVEAVYQATALSGGAQTGRVVNTGTLALGVGGLRYSPQPADRLVVILGQQTHEFVVKEARGNVQAATAAAWVMSPHILRYVHRLPGQAQTEIAARFDGVRFDVEVQGWYVQSGMRYELSLTASGQSSGRRDFHGQDVRTDYDLRGKISGGDLEIDVNEHHTSALAAATNLRLLPSQRGSASRFNAAINNVLRIGGVEYKLHNVQVQTDQKARGGQGQAGLTHLEGEILRAGATFGRLVLRAGRAILETASGPVALDPPPSGGAVR